MKKTEVKISPYGPFREIYVLSWDVQILCLDYCQKRRLLRHRMLLWNYTLLIKNKWNRLQCDTSTTAQGWANGASLLDGARVQPARPVRHCHPRRTLRRQPGGPSLGSVFPWVHTAQKNSETQCAQGKENRMVSSLFAVFYPWFSYFIKLHFLVNTLLQIAKGR